MAEHAILGASSFVNNKEWPVTEEMAEYVQIYVDAVRECVKETGGALIVEEKVNLNWIREGMFGTVDAAVIEDMGCIHTFDLKYGAGVIVEVKSNSQLKYYALGILGENNSYMVDTIKYTVVQPRARHKDGVIRSEEVSAEYLLTWGKTILLSAAAEASSPKAKCKAGEWCRSTFCPAQGSCNVLSEYAEKTLALDFAEPVYDMVVDSDMDIEKLESICLNSGIIKSFLEACAGELQQRLVNGETSEHFKLVNKKSNKSWISEEETEKFFRPIMEGAMYTKKLRSPSAMVKQYSQILKNQGEKKFGKLAEQRTEHLYERKNAGVVMAPVSDKRLEAPVGGVMDFMDTNFLD
jgi:hypothetical protein